MAVSVLVDIFAGFFPGDPAGCSCFGSDLAVHGHGVFQRDIGSAGLDIMEKDRVDGVAFLTHKILDDFDSVLLQDTCSVARYKRIGIAGSDDHSFDPAFENGVGAGGLLAVMAAGLQRYINSRAFR